MKIMKRVFAGALLLGSGIALAQTVEGMAASAKKVLAARLVEPSSLQLRNIHTKQVAVGGSLQMILCGEYNAKNRMGGYNGFKAFAYDPTTYKSCRDAFDGRPKGSRNRLL
ncbi:hypothetical protein [Allosphingosinicella vermicomposti]|uniref:hypothetical protein n=1 Tax=Allosphingosinicella vermicomposti TaxID=614671 RepID=UPI000D112096|nr:hypothetical protein [Allosphingosinicella vermicomposti]